MISRREIPSPSTTIKGKNFLMEMKGSFDNQKKKKIIPERTHTLYKVGTYCFKM